jgi:glucosamine-6-phosphate deaminase
MRPRLLIRPAPQAAVLAATALADALRQPGGLPLGLATGGTMVPVYAELVSLARSGKADLGLLHSFNLDEYVGLPVGHPASFAAFMRQHLMSPAGIGAGQVLLPDGAAADPAAEAARYEAAIAAAGGIGLQLLGLGRNGHIGFNEPGSDFASPCRVVQLAAQTRADNAAAFPAGEEVPHRAITLGIGTILGARRVLLLATGAAKAAALARALCGPPSPDCPASALQRHPAVTVICDPAAAAELPPALRLEGEAAHG